MIINYSHKMINIEEKYNIHDVKLLAIVETFRHWCHYLKKPHYTLEIFNDQSNLSAIMTIY